MGLQICLRHHTVQSHIEFQIMEAATKKAQLTMVDTVDSQYGSKLSQMVL